MAANVSPPRDNPYERASLALSNLISGRPGAAARAAAVPLTLSPAEQQTIADKWFGKEPSLWHSITSALTNPFVAIGAVLAITYPVARAENILAFTEKLGGYASRAGPLSKWFQDMHTLYRGTDIPDLFEGITSRLRDFVTRKSTAVGELLAKYEAESGQRYTGAVGAKIAAKLDGLDSAAHPVWQTVAKNVGSVAPPTISLNTAETNLYNGLRGVLRGSFADVLADPSTRRRAAGILDQLGIGAKRLGGEIADYWPHIALRSPVEAERAMQAAIAEGAPVGTSEMRRGLAAAPGKVLTKSAQARANFMLPSIEDLKRGGLWTPQLEAALRETAARMSEKAPVFNYSLNLIPAIENYHMGMGRTYAWTAIPEGATRPLGTRVMAELDKLKAAGAIPEAAMLTDTYIPMATGKLSAEGSLKAMQFSQTRTWARTAIDALPLSAATKEKLITSVEMNYPGRQAVGHALTRAFYMSTLGGNPVSAAVNLMQTLITTLPTLGAKYTAVGVERTLQGVQDYAAARGAGMEADAALKKAFPAFAGTQFDVSPMTRELLGHDLEQGWQASAGTLSRVNDRVRGVMMYMFRQTERFNRLVAFEGGRAKALAELPGVSWRNPITEEVSTLTAGSRQLNEAATYFGDHIARMTQFGGGLLNKPYGLINLWPPLSQFSQFPLRMFNFAANTATSLGAVEKAGFAGRNYGTLGRALLASGLTYEIGKSVLDTDLSRGLIASALPGFTEGKAFAPFPFVPPLLQIAGAGGLALAGDTSQLKSIPPLLMPGGTALTRAAGVIPTSATQQLARDMGRPWADYQHPAPDGRIPMYTGKDGLIGYFSPLQLFSIGAGIGALTPNRERALASYLSAQTDRIRGFRRDYLHALAINDPATAEKVKHAYAEAYPGLGELPVSQQDVGVIQHKQQVIRLQRMLNQLPEEARPQFAAIVAQSLGESMANLAGASPEALQAISMPPTPPQSLTQPQSRKGKQMPTPAQSGRGNQGTGRSQGLPGPGQGPSSSAIRQARAAGMQRRDSLLDNSFSAFDSF